MTTPLIALLTRALRIGEREVLSLIATAPRRYKVYTIPKRSGGRRIIAHPAVELKAAQRALVEHTLSKLPVHYCATAYKAGSSIRVNAERHSHNRAILKYDFVEFFPSITEQAWLVYCDNHDVFDRSDAIMSGRILFRRPKGSQVLRLSIGAPSSPMLSNVLMNDFDRQIYDRVSDHKIVYTRYADDLTFSAERTWNLRSVDKILRSVISNMGSPRLNINERKTVLVTPKYHRQITGLVITNDGRVSLGRDRKRVMRATIHHYLEGLLDESQQVKLAGMLAFAKDVEPEFYTRMERVYGKSVIDEIKSSITGYHRSIEPSGILDRPTTIDDII